jgi:hypothetical protein
MDDCENTNVANVFCVCNHEWLYDANTVGLAIAEGSQLVGPRKLSCSIKARRDSQRKLRSLTLAKVRSAEHENFSQVTLRD